MKARVRGTVAVRTVRRKARVGSAAVRAGRRRIARAVALSIAVVGASAVPATGQSTLERTPNLDGPWVSNAGMAHFHLIHRFWATEPPARKVVNTPTITVAAGLGQNLLAGFRYASNSLLISTPNEWEAYARWRPLAESSGPADVAVTAAWNDAAGSVDGELAVARSLGPVRLHISGRAFTAFAAGGDPELAYGGGASWRVHRNVALAGDVMTLARDTTLGWGVGLQLRIPTTPHTVSLHATNVNTTTLQGSSFGSGFIDPDTGEPRTLYGFEFTVPITLSRYFGGGGSSEPAPEMTEADQGRAPQDTAIVRMDNRLRFLPDTVRIRAGEAVRWENTSDLVHTVTADPAMAALESSVSLPAGAGPFHSGDLAPEAVYVRVFRVPGTYKYFCVPHERAGMVGWVVVEGDDSDRGT